MAATGRKRPEPLTIPKESKTSYFITNSGTFQEGDLVISRDGLVIGDSDSPASTRTCSSRGSTFSSRGPSRDRSSSRQGSAPRTGANGAVEEPSPRVAADEGEPFGVALDDLEELGVIGHGSSGVVRKVRHRATGHLLVLKVIPFDVQCDQLRKQVTTELRTLHGSCNKAIVKNYQSFFDSGAITIVMEYMDGGSLANVLKSNSRIPEIYLAEISRQVLEGLLYLHKELRVVHRDIKPSNLLLNSRGEMKISDFGVSHQLANSVSKCQSWVGTVTYMSPERIAGGPYSVDSDVWSFALTIVECALGRFPYPPQQEDGGYAPVALGFWDLLDFIVSEPAPILPPDQFSPELCDFVNSCLKKDPEKRATCEGLLQHPFLQKYKKVNLADLLLPHG